MGSHTGARRGRRVFALACAVVGVLVGARVAAAEMLPGSGPLTNIEVSPLLNCSAELAGEPLFYDQSACGTFVASGGVLFGPDELAAGGSASPRVVWTPVSQSDVLASGSADDPFRIVTTVSGGALTLTETDAYVPGNDRYRTEITIHNTSATSQSGILYRAGDCTVSSDDTGYGLVLPAFGAVACEHDPASSRDGGAVLEWLPATPGSSYFEGFYDDLWHVIGAQQPFDDSCRCEEWLDDAAGLSWPLSLPPDGSETFSQLTIASQSGNRLVFSAAPDADVVTPGGSDGYTVVAANPTWSVVTLDQLTLQLPPGASYIAGSTSGWTSAEPRIDGQQLTWAGPYQLDPATSIALHLRVTAPSAVGDYTASVAGDAEDAVFTPGVWPPGAGMPSFRWLRAGQPIPQATLQAYTPQPADIGAALSCQETVPHGARSFSLSSAPTTLTGLAAAPPATPPAPPPAQPATPTPAAPPAAAPATLETGGVFPPPQPGSTTRFVTLGALRARLSYHATRDAAGRSISRNARLAVLDAGQLVLDAPLPVRSGEQIGRSEPLAARNLDAQGDPEIIVRLTRVAAHCCQTALIYRRSGPTYVPLRRSFAAGYTLIAGRHGTTLFRSADVRFLDAFTDDAHSALPIQLLAYQHGHLGDVTRQTPALVRSDAARWWRTSRTALRTHRDARGALAAWAADQSLLGRGARALRQIARAAPLAPHPGTHPSRAAATPTATAFVQRLRRFLIRTGYLP